MPVPPSVPLEGPRIAAWNPSKAAIAFPLLLPSVTFAAMMLATMSEQSAQHERTANEPIEHLTFAEAGKRPNISADAFRMRVTRGKLASVQLDDRTFVLWPQPESCKQTNEPRTEHVRSNVQDDSRLVAALEAHIASLEHQLAERSEEIRRRDHIIAGFLERLPETREIGPGDILDIEERYPTTAKTPHALQDAPEPPERTDHPPMNN